jgi:putative transposase
MTYITTYKFKLKNGARNLDILASKVNFVWNYCNEVGYQTFNRDRKCLSGFDLNNLTSGTAKVLKLNSTTVQEVGEQVAKSKKRHKKIKLNWRNKKSLGWVPFKAAPIKIKDNTIKFAGKVYKFHKSRELIGELRTGEFVQDSCGDWYICLVYKVDKQYKINNLSVGVDLGLSTIATTSDGQVFENPKLTNKYADELAMAQRTHNKKKVSRLHRKIKRKRLDNLHKISTELSSTYSTIVVGNLKLKKSKQTNDASFRGLIPLLKYKANRLGGLVTEVNEAYSTKICSNCLAETGPTGLQGLAVREWTCGRCGQSHHRDINAAINILRFGYKAPKTNNELQASYCQGLLGGAQ